MPTYGTPGNLYGQAKYDLTFEYDIDIDHSGSFTVHFDAPPDADPENDHTVVNSFIAAVSASSDWGFTGGFRGWSASQSITP